MLFCELRSISYMLEKIHIHRKGLIIKCCSFNLRLLTHYFPATQQGSTTYKSSRYKAKQDISNMTTFSCRATYV